MTGLLLIGVIWLCVSVLLALCWSLLKEWERNREAASR